MCVPHFDGDPLFGRLVGGPGGGHIPRRSRRGRARLIARRYRPGTATLETDLGDQRRRDSTLTEGMVAELGRSPPADDAPRASPDRRRAARSTLVIEFDPRAR